MKLSIFFLLCFIICVMCNNDEEIPSHKRIARQATTKKAATTTKKPATTTKKAATTTKKAGATTKKTTTTLTIPILRSFSFDYTDYEETESSDYNMYYDYGNAPLPVQSSKSPIVSTTRRPSNSRPSYYPSWSYYSFLRWFTPRFIYQPRNSRNYFNFMSRPSYYRYFRRN